MLYCVEFRGYVDGQAPGTVIGDIRTSEDVEGAQFVKGFATIDDVSLINVEVCL